MRDAVLRLVGNRPRALHVPASARADARARPSSGRCPDGRVGCHRGHDRADDADSRPRGGRLPRRERRAQLLDSALEVFVAQGYHAAAMDDIAERAGVSKPVLYQHFPGKLDLYLALLDAVVRRRHRQLPRRRWPSTHDNKTAGRGRRWRRSTPTSPATSGAFRLVFESDLTSEPAVREHVERVTTECAAMIADVIHDDTGLPGEASRLLAVSLVGMAQVSARFWLSEAAGITQDEAAALVTGLAWRGIRGYPLTDEH